MAMMSKPLGANPLPMKVLVCPSGFKESLEPDMAADCIEKGVLRVLPDAIIQKIPLVDGGEGFTKGMIVVTNGSLHQVQVTGPVRQKVDAHYGMLGGTNTAVIEMAAAAGLRLVPKDQRDPGLTTTYGVGELILAALDKGVDKILLGCGDSGTSDGGVGMLQALGGRLLDSHGLPLPLASGGKDLAQLASIDLSELDGRLGKVCIEVACNWHNVLCGPKGVARGRSYN
jgi:glycerate kinase